MELMNTAFIYLRSDAYSARGESVRQLVTNVFEHSPIVVEREGGISLSRVRRDELIDQQFAPTSSYAMTSGNLSMRSIFSVAIDNEMNDDEKAKFYHVFGFPFVELITTEFDRVISAADAVDLLSDYYRMHEGGEFKVTTDSFPSGLPTSAVKLRAAAELASLFEVSKNKLQLTKHINIAQIKLPYKSKSAGPATEDLFVVNAFYPFLRDCYVFPPPFGPAFRSCGESVFGFTQNDSLNWIELKDLFCETFGESLLSAIYRGAIMNSLGASKRIASRLALQGRNLPDTSDELYFKCGKMLLARLTQNSPLRLDISYETSITKVDVPSRHNGQSGESVYVVNGESAALASVDVLALSGSPPKLNLDPDEEEIFSRTFGLSSAEAVEKGIICTPLAARTTISRVLRSQGCLFPCDEFTHIEFQTDNIMRRCSRVMCFAESNGDARLVQIQSRHSGQSTTAIIAIKRNCPFSLLQSIVLNKEENTLFLEKFNISWDEAKTGGLLIDFKGSQELLCNSNLIQALNDSQSERQENCKTVCRDEVLILPNAGIEIAAIACPDGTVAFEVGPTDLSLGLRLTIEDKKLFAIKFGYSWEEAEELGILKSYRCAQRLVLRAALNENRIFPITTEEYYENEANKYIAECETTMELQSGEELRAVHVPSRHDAQTGSTLIVVFDAPNSLFLPPFSEAELSLFYNEFGVAFDLAVREGYVVSAKEFQKLIEKFVERQGRALPCGPGGITREAQRILKHALSEPLRRCTLRDNIILVTVHVPSRHDGQSGRNIVVINPEHLSRSEVNVPRPWDCCDGVALLQDVPTDVLISGLKVGDRARFARVFGEDVTLVAQKNLVFKEQQFLRRIEEIIESEGRDWGKLPNGAALLEKQKKMFYENAISAPEDSFLFRSGINALVTRLPSRHNGQIGLRCVVLQSDQFSLEDKKDSLIYSCPGDYIYYYVVSWDPLALSWRDFFYDIIGIGDLQEVGPGSIGKVIEQNWASLGLCRPPSSYDAVVHASASPLEALHELSIWLGKTFSFSSIAFARTLLISGGFSEDALRDLLKNPAVTISGRHSAPIFDIMRFMDAPKAINLLREYSLQLSMPPIINTAVIVVKPCSSTERVRFLVESSLALRGIRIIINSSVTADSLFNLSELFSHLYGKFRRYAVEIPGSQLYQAIKGIGGSAEDPRASLQRLHRVEKRFFSAFGCELSEVCEVGQVLNAMEALTTLRASETITSEHLLYMWLSSKGSHCKLLNGLIVTRLQDYNNFSYFVLNGFYPAAEEQFLTPLSPPAHLYVVSWSETDLTWAQFNERVIGAMPPEEADRESIRGYAFWNWRELGLLGRPDKFVNVVHCSDSPLEALSDRVSCIHSSFDDDTFVRLCSERNVHPQLVLREWISRFNTAGVTVETVEGLRLPDGSTSQPGDVYEIVRGMQTSTLIEVLRCADTAACLRCAFKQRNYSFVFLKPHASCSENAYQLVKRFMSEKGIQIDNEGCTTAEEIRDNLLVEKHYSLIAKYALAECNEHYKCAFLNFSRELGPAAWDAFQLNFGTPWEVAVHSHRILSAVEALQVLNLSPRQLYRLWNNSSKCKNKSKIAPGLVMAQFDATEPLFLANGYFPYLRDCYIFKNAAIKWFTVSWDEEALTWADFRSSVIGVTDPKRAVEGSLRSIFLKNWKDLKIPLEPNITDNCVHASAGPLEALNERLLWMRDRSVMEDQFGYALVRGKKLPVSLIQRLLENPRLSFFYGARVFDSLEDKQSSETADLLARFYAKSEEELKISRAVFVVKPSAVSHNSIGAINELLKMTSARIGMSITYSCTFSVDAYTARSSFWANMRDPIVSTIVLTRAREVSFSHRFGESWSACVLRHSVLTPVKAWRFLIDRYERLSEDEKCRAAEDDYNLLYLWRCALNDGLVMNLTKTLQVAYIPLYKFYVINGGDAPTVTPATLVGAALQRREDRMHPASTKPFMAAVFALEWPSLLMTYEQFYTDIIGLSLEKDSVKPVFTQSLFPGVLNIVTSLRTNWRDYSLRAPPEEADGFGVIASTDALSAAAMRLVWCSELAELDRLNNKVFFENAVSTDPLVSHLLDLGISCDLILYLLSNPFVPYASHATQSCKNSVVNEWTTAAEFLSSHSTAELPEILKKLHARIGVRELEKRLRGVSTAPAQSAECIETNSHESMLTRVRAQKDSMRNCAFMYLYPCFTSESVVEVIEDNLQEHNLRIEASGLVSTEDVVSERLVDRQYKDISRYALDVQLAEVDAALTDSQRHEFENVFGVSWIDARRCKLVITAGSLMSQYGFSEEQLQERWDASEKHISLLPTLEFAEFFVSCTQMFVINGFYPLLRSRMIEPGKFVRWYVISFPEKSLSWNEFCLHVVGQPSSGKPAAEGSLQSILLSKWDEYTGEASAPCMEKQYIYVSSSPVEAFANRQVWLGRNEIEDSFFNTLVNDRHLPPEFVNWCAMNPYVSLSLFSSCSSNSDAKNLPDEAEQCVVELRSGLLFTLLEGCNTSVSLDVIQRLYLSQCEANRINTALLVIKPHAALPLVQSLVENAIENSGCGMKIVHRGVKNVTELRKEKLIDKLYPTEAFFAQEWENDVQRAARAEQSINLAELTLLETRNPLLLALETECLRSGGESLPVRLWQFENKFHVTLPRALRRGILLSATAALDYIERYVSFSKRVLVGAARRQFLASGDKNDVVAPDLSLARRWENAKNTMELMNGVFVREIVLDGSPDEFRDVSKCPSALEELKDTAIRSADDERCPLSTEETYIPSDVEVEKLSAGNVLPASRILVINGYYPKLLHDYVAQDTAHAPWYVVQWPAHGMSWEKFALDFVGDFDPTKANPYSLIGEIFANWKQFGLRTCPSGNMNGIHASHSPVEGVTESLLWSDRSSELKERIDKYCSEEWKEKKVE